MATTPVTTGPEVSVTIDPIEASDFEAQPEIDYAASTEALAEEILAALWRAFPDGRCEVTVRQPADAGNGTFASAMHFDAEYGWTLNDEDCDYAYWLAQDVYNEGAFWRRTGGTPLDD